MSRSASARAASTLVWLSATSSSRRVLPNDLMPPAALTASTASWAPSRESWPTSAMGPVSGSTMPIWIVRGWARSTAGKAPTPREAAVATRRKSRRLRRLEPMDASPRCLRRSQPGDIGGEVSTRLASPPPTAPPHTARLVTSASEGDANHAGRHDGGAGETLAQLAFLEEDAADQRGDHDGNLTPRHHVAGLGDSEGAEHEEVAARAQETQEEDGEPVLVPLSREGARTTKHGRQQRHARAQHHGPQVRQGIDVGDADLVHERVRGDAEPGGDGPTGARTQQRVLAPRATPPVQGEDPAHDQDDAEDSQAREPLVEPVVGAHGNDGDSQSSGHGIDHREVARLIRLAEGEEIHAV